MPSFAYANEIDSLLGRTMKLEELDYCITAIEKALKRSILGVVSDPNVLVAC